MVPAFVKAGVKGLALLASNAEKLAATEKSVKETNPNIETLTYALDISDTKGVEAAFEAIRQKFGHADVLVNAAGAMTGDGPKLHDTDPDQWWRNFVRSDPFAAHPAVTGSKVHELIHSL
jgi:NADP-dependent 3-hydroxy acid dehydrogenase YdfG